MTPPGRRAPPVAAIRRLSAEALFLGLTIASVLCALLFTAAILTLAQRTNAAAMDRIGAGLLARLEEGGASAVILAVEQVDAALSPTWDRFEVAIWRRQGGTGQNATGPSAGWRLVRESGAGAAAMLEAVPIGAQARFAADGRRFEAAALDVAAVSAGWESPFADIRIAYAMELPTEATRAARGTLGAIWAGYAFALCMGALLHANHRARYRAGLGHISAVLAAFSDGRTSARVEPGLTAPELVRVGAQINAVLPRIEQLMAGLRYVSAHLAHEIRTPLQAIHSDVARLARTGDQDERRRIEVAIHKTIDQADARLQSVMRLFRLQAGERVEMQDGIDLGALVEEQVFDLQDLLEGGERTLALAIAPGVLIRCNPQLMEVLVINLLSNAAKYSPPGACIEVELTADSLAEFTLAKTKLTQTDLAQTGPTQDPTQVGGRFRLRIGNSGGRFPQALGTDAFSRFARAEGQEAVAGFGLGLSTVAGVAAQHGFSASIAPPRGDDNDEGEPWAEVLLLGLCHTAPDAPAQ